MVPWYAWVAFVAALIVFLGIDLRLHRESRRIPVRQALAWTLVWVGVGLAFGALLWWLRGAETAGEYVAGYLIEWSLSVDNVFVFILIMAHFAVPEPYQHRVLFWGVLGAVVMRLGFILGGVALLRRFEWMVLVFGGVLLVTAVRFLRERGQATSLEENAVLRLIRRVVPVTDRYEGQHLLTRVDGRRAATPLLAALILVNVADVVFAVDSIPAVFSVTKDPFVAFTSNALAILGLRSLYFVLAGSVGSLRYLKPALAAVLVFVAAKMVISPWYDVPIAPSLTVIVILLGIGVVASLRRNRTPGPKRDRRTMTKGAASAPVIVLLLVVSVLAATVLMILALEFLT